MASATPRARTERASVMRALLAFTLLAVGAAPAAPPERTPAAVPIYDRDMDGQRQLEASSRFCLQSGRRLVLNFGVNDCATCRVVNQAMHEPKFYEAFIKDFLPVFIDVTPGSKNAEILKRFQIDPKKGLPAIVVFDAQFKPQDVTRKGEIAKLAKKGVEPVQLWFLAKFPKDDDR
jgi:thiol:disulfide interchange protein